MELETLIQKLNLEEEWSYLQKTPSSFLLDTFLQKVLDDLEKQGLILFLPSSKHIIYLDDQCDIVFAQLFKIVSPLYGLESNSSSIKEICVEYSLSLEKKVERAAKAWGWKSLDEVLGWLTVSDNLQDTNLEPALKSLDNFILTEPLARCLLSESKFIRERRLFLETNQRIKK